MWHTCCGQGGSVHTPVPVGECHHNVDRSEYQAQVEEGIAVGDTVLLVVKGPALGDHHLLLLLRGVQHRRALLRLHQAVHLPVV